MKKKFYILSAMIIISEILYAGSDYSRYGKPWDVDDNNMPGSGGIIFLVIFIILIIIGAIRSKRK